MKWTGPSSLRGRLLIGLIAGIVLLQLAAGGTVYLLQRQALYARFDQGLVFTARGLASLIKSDDIPEAGGAGATFEGASLSMPEFQRSKGPDYFQIWGSDGTVLARSQTLGDADLPTAPAAVKPAKFDCLVPRREPGRAVQLTIPLPPAPGKPGRNATLVVAKETKPVRNDLRTLQWILAGTTLASAVLAAGLARTVVQRSLQPVQRVGEQIAGIELSLPQDSLDDTPLPLEIRPLVQRMNQMLERLRSSFAREKAFTADAAHELRTPLAALRSLAEVALASPQSQEEYQHDLRDVLEVARSMQSMVETLLTLARLESASGGVELGAVPVRTTIAPLLETWQPRLQQRRIEVTNDVPAALHVRADRKLLDVVLGNAIDNAVEYVEDGGRITFRCSAGNGTALLVISNTGCALTPGQAAQVFDRFWRADPARSGNSHWGLGLSLVARAMARMGGSAAAEATDGGEFRLMLRFPLEATEAPAPGGSACPIENCCPRKNH